jgi:hypothetical protein
VQRRERRNIVLGGDNGAQTFRAPACRGGLTSGSAGNPARLARPGSPTRCRIGRSSRRGRREAGLPQRLNSSIMEPYERESRASRVSAFLRYG